MTIETDFYSTLSGDGGVSALVGTKIHPHIVPEGTALPYITYSMVVGTPFNKLAGRTGLEKKRIQVNCWASTYAAAKALAEAVKTALDSTSHLLLELDDYEDHAQVQRVILDFSFIG